MPSNIMVGVVVVLVLIGGGVVALLVFWRARAAPAMPPVETMTASGVSTDEKDTMSPDLTLAHDRLALLEQASRALFGPEYLAASQVDSWRQSHPEVLTWAADSTWLRGLPADLVALIDHYRQPFGDLATAVTAHNDVFLTRRMQEDADAFDRVERFPLTVRQRQAIVTDEDTTLVIAGAGTGKTSTIIGKVDYLLRRKLATPDEILVLAYASKAADELKTRVQGLGHHGMQIRTFHSLGNSIITAAEGRMKNISQLATSQPAKQAFLQACLANLWLDPVQRTTLLDFFISLLDEPTRTQAASAPTRAASRFRTLAGQDVRSGQEVQIANWLTLHGIAYEYERPYPVATATDERRQYLPDFYLPEYDLYLEHFGVDRQGRTRDDINAQEYRKDMAWKRELHRTNGTRLLETYSYFEAEGGIPHHLEQIIRSAGILIQPLPAAAIANLFAHAESSANNFVRLLDQFLQLFDGSGLDLATVQARAQTPRDHAFLALFTEVAQRYHAELARTESIDFNTMISAARAAIQAGGFTSRFCYIIVDEFQDISRQRLELVRDLRAQVPHAKLFVVGDDWQAIYRFTGSDIALITSLEQHVGQLARVDLDTTFRYPQEILDVSALFVTMNPAQLKKDLRAYAGAAGEPPLVRVHLADTTPVAGAQALDAAITDIRRQLGGTPGSILILGRYNRQQPDDLEERAARLKQQGITLTFQTMHAAKGKEADYVILVGLEDGRLSFPSTIPDDPLVRLVLPQAEPFPFAEERRLFYVALTRARKRVYLMIPAAYPSLFLMKLEQPQYAPYLTTLVAPAPHYPCPICTEPLIIRHDGQRGPEWRCVAVPACPGALPHCRSCNAGAMLPITLPEPGEECSACKHTVVWCPQCEDGTLVERTSKHGVFLACSEWRGGAGCRYTRSLTVQR